MKKIFLLAAALLVSSITFSQTNVHVKGVGLNRDEALKDALRAAVSQASGVVIDAYSTMENFVLLKDVVNAQTSGVVTSYEITKETPLTSTYEIEIDAVVSQEAIKKNADALQFLVGGIRFLVLYDPRKFSEEINAYLSFTVERINEYLETKEYRYVEMGRLEELKEPALKILGSDTSTTSYMEKIGMYADAQFIVLLKNLSIREQGGGTKATIEIKTYDNCQAEGLGTIEMEGIFSKIENKDDAVKQSIKEAIARNIDRLLMFFSTNIGKWANNGCPYALKFFDAGGYSDFIELKNKLKSDPDFAGAIEISAMENYISLRCKFKKVPDELADKIILLLREDPILKDKNIDVKHIYQRQIYFAPKSVVVPEVQDVKNVQAGIGKGER
jgi:hypothetical protein